MQFRRRLEKAPTRSFEFFTEVGSDPIHEHMARQAASGLYNAVSPVVLAWDGAHPNGDARKLLVSHLVLEHRAEVADPLSPPNGGWEHAAYAFVGPWSGSSLAV